MKKLVSSIIAFVFIGGLSITLVHAEVSGSATIQNPFIGGGNLYELFKAIINQIVLPIGGVLAVLAFIYSGFMYVIAQGEPKAIEKAHNTLLYTSIGTAILLGSWIIANVLENTIKLLQPSS